MAPPPAQNGPELAPPDSHEKPLIGREKNQKPASGPTGISFSIPSGNASALRITPHVVSESVPPALTSLSTPVPIAQATIPTGPLPVATGSGSPATSRLQPESAGKPNLRDVVLDDLKDTGRLLDLYDQSVALGYVTTSERDRLRFVSAAEHARVIGTKNPCGLFVRLVRCGLWSFLTQDDEDAANTRLKRHLYRMTPQEQAPVIAPVREAVGLSADARVVQAIQAAVARTRYRGCAFPLLKRDHPEWTRERWDRALAELEQASHLGGR